MQLCEQAFQQDILQPTLTIQSSRSFVRTIKPREGGEIEEESLTRRTCYQKIRHKAILSASLNVALAGFPSLTRVSL
jgi:hypothetical protein